MANPNTAIYPAAVAADTDLFVASNGARTTLRGSHNSAVTTIALASAVRFTGVPCTLSIDDEIIIAPAAASGNSFAGCTRGAMGTTAAAHSDGAVVSGFLTAWHFNQLAAEVKALEARNQLFNPSLLTGASFIRLVGSNLPTGDNDLYTVPAGKRLYCGQYQAMNPTGGSIICYPELKVGSTYYRLSGSVTLTTGIGALTGLYLAYDAGDVVAFNCATTAGLNVFIPAVLADATSGAKTARKLGLTTGNNTLYTVPSGKSASILGTSNAVPWGTTGSGTVNAIADGTGRNVIYYNVPSGGTPGATNQATASAAVAANSILRSTVDGTLATGDFLVVNVDVGNAAQVVWVNIIEI